MKPFLKSACGGIKRGTVTLLPFLCLMVSCDFFTDLVTPVERSTARVEGWIFDGQYDGVVPSDAVVALGGQETSCDDGGRFVFPSALTGSFNLSIRAPGYDDIDTVIRVTLSGRSDTLYLERTPAAPRIDSFTCYPSPTYAVDDTVICVFCAHDSTGGIDGFGFDYGDGYSLFRPYESSQFMITGTVLWVYDAGGTYELRLSLYGGDGDTTDTVLCVAVSSNRRPDTSYIRTDVFLAGVEGYIEIDAFDPDDNFSHQVIDWGDGSLDIVYEPYAILWHAYTCGRDTTFPVQITLYDSAGASKIVMVNLEVRKLDPPRLDDVLEILPTKYLGPLDDSVTIGVLILDVEDYVEEIVWIVNQGSASEQYYRLDTDAQSGQVQVPEGTVFAHTFATQDLGADNAVRVIVTDRFGHESVVSGSFTISGKDDN